MKREEGDARFHTTRWSLIGAAAENAPEARDALAALCRIYWSPVYSYVRHQGRSPEEAQDLTQDFFLRLLEKGSFACADQTRGKFRSFLLRSLQHFLINDWHHQRTTRRGGSQPHISLDFEAAERGLSRVLSATESPESIYERQWALRLLEKALESLLIEMTEAGNRERFFELKDLLTMESEVSMAELAARLGMTQGAVRVAVYRMRRRFGGILRNLVADTVEDPREVEAELRYLQKVLAAGGG